MNKFSSFYLICCVFAALIISATDNLLANARVAPKQTLQGTRNSTKKNTAPSNIISDSECQCVSDYKNLSYRSNLTPNERSKLAELKKCECVVDYMQNALEERENGKTSDETIMANELDQQVSGKRARLQQKEMKRKLEAAGRQNIDEDEHESRQKNERTQSGYGQDDWMHEEAKDSDMLTFNMRNNTILNLKTETLNHISRNLFDYKKYVMAEAEHQKQGKTDSDISNKNTENSNREHKKYRISKKESRKLLKELDKYRKIYTCISGSYVTTAVSSAQMLLKNRRVFAYFCC